MENSKKLAAQIQRLGEEVIDDVQFTSPSPDSAELTRLKTLGERLAYMEGYKAGLDAANRPLAFIRDAVQTVMDSRSEHRMSCTIIQGDAIKAEQTAAQR